jgi:hypothetical protein
MDQRMRTSSDWSAGHRDGGRAGYCLWALPDNGRLAGCRTVLNSPD